MSGGTDDLDAARAAALERLRAEIEPPRANGGPPPSERDAYAGLATRMIAFAVDAAIINAVAATVAVTIGLGLSILHLPSQLDKVVAAIGGVVWILWSIGYFVLFWSSTGQTPGNRLLHIRVVDSSNGATIRPWRATIRLGAVMLAVLPLGAGILRMLWDDRRRCFQDRFVRTVVVWTPDAPVATGAMSYRARAAQRASQAYPPRALPPGPVSEPAAGASEGDRAGAA